MSNLTTTRQEALQRLVDAAKALAAKSQISHYCVECCYGWPATSEPRHSGSCSVGAVLRAVKDVCFAPGESGAGRAEILQKDSASERSMAEGTGEEAGGGRGEGIRRGLPNVILGIGFGYSEPWHVDTSGCIWSRYGLLLVDMQGSDLVDGEDVKVARRIALCVNLFAGVSDEEVERRATEVAEAQRVLSGSSEVKP